MPEQRLVQIQEEVKRELATPEVVQSLLEARFKGLTVELMKKAIVEGMIRGFSINDFFEGNVYAIPFKMKKGEGQYELTYSIVTSLDNSRKIGAKSGIVGMDEPVFGSDTFGDHNDAWCSITVHKKQPDGYVGDYTAKVYLSEYTTDKNLWVSKPRTMLAKVAEMHALRKACPELAESYLAEEVEKPMIVQSEAATLNMDGYKAKLAAAKDMAELGTIWSALPMVVKDDKDIQILKEDLKLKFDPDH